MSPTSGPLVHELAIPAASDFIATTRLFVSGVAGIVTSDEELVEDLKLAVSEIVTAIVEYGGIGVVTVTVATGSSQLRVDVAPWPSDIPGEPLGPLDIVDALFPGAESADGVVRLVAILEGHA